MQSPSPVQEHGYTFEEPSDEILEAWDFGEEVPEKKHKKRKKD